MPTKYDVFAKIIKCAPCKPKDLGFNKPIYAHITVLLSEQLIKKNQTGCLIPIKTKKSELYFKIIRFCLKNNLDYNIFLSTNTLKTLTELKKTNLRPKALSGNNDVLKILKYLESNQFILVRKQRPKTGTLLNHTLFRRILELNNKKFNITEYFETYSTAKKQVLNYREEINPFDDKVFEFLSGSAQLEGCTVSVGETIDLIKNDIYPDKPAKDILIVKNLNQAMKLVMNNSEKKITPDLIKEINKNIMFSLHEGAGEFKRTQNKIHGNPTFKTTDPKLVGIEIERYCNELNQINSRSELIDKLGYVHNELQRIHPFADGNSRTTRMVVNLMLLKFGFPIFVLKTGSFEKYMSLTKLSSSRSDDLLREFFSHILIHEKLLN